MKKQEWSLLRKLICTKVINMCARRLHAERRAAKGDNFLPCARDQRSLLPPAWQDWLPEGNLDWFIFDAVAQRGAQRMNFGCPTGSIIGLSNRLEDAFIPYRTQPSLTRRCQMGDNYSSDVCSLIKRPQIALL